MKTATKKTKVILALMLAVSLIFTSVAVNAVMSDSAAATTLKLSGQSVPPSTITQGSAVNVRGTITSSSKIKNVYVGFKNSAGTKWITGSTPPVSRTPNATSFNLATIDNYIRYDLLPVGSYRFSVEATDSSGTYQLQSSYFTVVAKSAASTMALSSTRTTIASQITKGSAVNVKGTITSNYNITNVKVGFKNSSGAWMTGSVAAVTRNPNAKSYNLATIDDYVRFDLLAAGSYTFVVEATDSKGTKTLQSTAFKVVASSSTASTMALSSTRTSIGSQITKGSAVNVKGTITSNYNITNVKVGFKNSSGAWMTGSVAAVTRNPNAKSYNLAAIDDYVRFDLLAAGSYTFVVEATDSKGTKTLQSTAFKVVNPSSNSSYRSRIVSVAQNELYYKANPSNKYGEWYRGSSYNTEAWCAFFVSWCARQANIPTSSIINYSWCQSGINFFKQNGRYYTRNNRGTPQAGDIIFFDWNGDGTSDHTGIVTSANSSKVYTIEGNTGGGGTNTSSQVLPRNYDRTYGCIMGYGTY